MASSDNSYATMFATSELTKKLTPCFGTGAVFSPYSVYSLLYFLFEGADDSSRRCLAGLLGLDPDVTHWDDFLRLNKMIGESGVFKIWNCLATRNDVAIKNEFMDRSGGSFDKLRYDSPSGLMAGINRLVYDKTNGLIHDILNGVDPDTRVLLCNTVYFASKWTHPFKEYNTHERDFTTSNKSIIKLPLMSNRIDSLRYCETDKYQYVELPYGDGKIEFSMDVLLPRDSTTLRDYFNDDLFRSCGDSAKNNEVVLYFPKFTQRLRQSLKDVVSSIGGGELFSGVNLSRMTLVNPIQVSDIIHEAVVIVDEEKTEAAAVTTSGMAGCCPPSGPYVPPKYVVFRADHSFTYRICHIPTNTTLFIGSFDG